MRKGLAVCLLVGCATATPPDAPKKKKYEPRPELGERTPRSEAPAVDAMSAQKLPVAIVGGKVWVGDGRVIEDATILFEGGRLTGVGPSKDVAVPAEAMRFEAKGKLITPGLIDTHSHIGVYPVPYVLAHADGNEMTDPTTPYVFSEHSFWPQDPSIQRIVAGGVTTAQILPGSGNIIGGRAVTLKLRPSLDARAMRFPNAPNGLKMACGENPKRVYGTQGRAPMSRMGSISKLRAAFIEARAYRHDQRVAEIDREEWKKKVAAAKAKPDDADDPGKEPFAPPRDLGKETLADALEGVLQVQVHCYRADEMLMMIELSKELGFKIASFHHAVEAYKIADVLAREGVGASMWADWWGFKIEAYDGIEENAAIVAAAGGLAIIHSDSAIGAQRLNQEAAKALYAGKRAGLLLEEEQAIAWITKNPATALGVAAQTGTVEIGKMADLVVWDRNPFSVYAVAEKVFVDGVLAHDTDAPGPTWSDFEVGTAIEGGWR
ncbi:MAG: amidohydrolase family protein [Deltaproteobacteria bacterium]|nr:amidohydrolase family protein [Deltaproteobacteria bacterium]